MRILFIVLLATVLVQCADTEKGRNETIDLKKSAGSKSENHCVFVVPEVPDEIEFADENINLTDIDVRERFDRELIVNNFWHSNTILYIKRANRWFPVMKKILRENGVPEDFVYLSVIESGLTQATSPYGAKGFWQFMESTATEYNLIVNKEVDERLNVEKSTQAACKYLKKAYLEFGTWTLAAASYNRGVKGIQNALDNQKVDSYFDLSLNEETSRYVFRVLAIKKIMESPQKFGFDIDEEQLYPPYEYKKIQVEENIEDLATWAREQKTSLKIIRRLNPWIKGSQLNGNRHSKFTILIPEHSEQLGMYEG